MAEAIASFREAGSGPATVVCFHSNASHSGQWRGLMDRLSDRFRVIAIDSYGSGKSPEWPSAERIALADEVALAQPVLDALAGPVYLVGHSYGGAVALKAALADPGRYAGLALYEPTFFAAVDAVQPPPNDVDGIRGAVQRAVACLRADDPAGAGRAFIDFWMGEGAWDAMPAERQRAVGESTRNVARWAHALMTEPARLEDLARLRMPALVLTGGRSPRSSLCVADLVVPVLPAGRRVRLEALGHMGPVTDPGAVNDAIAAFLDEMAYGRATS
jgi:pimeloyl-ACP methyl ester carboxylesterase